MLDLFAFGLPPFLILFVAAIVAACTRGILQKIVLIAAPVISVLNFIALPESYSANYQLFDINLQIAFSDKLARLFGYLFHLAAFIGVIYAIQVKDTIQHVAALAYAACAIGAVFAGDWISLFLFWEGLALTSVFLIWARRSERSYNSGIRYLIMQVLSGVLLLAGALILMNNGVPAKVGALSLADNGNSAVMIGSWLIFVAFGIKAGFPLLHTWITDSYPEATATGTVFLSAFTTKVAVYALARCFAGTELLIPIGLIMVCFPLIFAVIENDLRRTLTYSMINQIGFMVCGIGIGTELAINGTVAHAFNDVLFKGLLMMTMGVVLLRTGSSKITDLGGLYRSMPKTAFLCIIGAASIAAVPLFNGFVSKAIIMGEMIYAGHTVGWLILLFASAVAFQHADIKVPFFAFFERDNNIKVKEAPLNMLIAMSISAAFCIGIGIKPELLYQLLPYDMAYNPYDLTHVVTQLQILFFSALMFVIFKLKGWYPKKLEAINLDSDWFTRKAFPSIYKQFSSLLISITTALSSSLTKLTNIKISSIQKMSKPYGILARGWGANNMIFVIVMLLGVLLFFRY